MIDLEVLKGYLIIGGSSIFGIIPLNVSLADPNFVSLIQSYVSILGVITGIVIAVYNAFFKK